VPKEHVSGLFERFGHTGTSSAGSSNGLGLWIASTMAAAYGGRVWYEPHSPTGSRFCAKLPAASPSSTWPLA
jgi:signal transduction histidine kinase